MYKLLEIDDDYVELFFIFENLETGTKVACYELGNFEKDKDLEVFHFMQEGNIYDCLIMFDGHEVDKKENSWENYYEILELNVRVGWSKFAKVKLNNDIYYFEMDSFKNVKDLENKKTVILSKAEYHLLKINDVINPVYNITEEDIPVLIEKVKNDKKMTKVMQEMAIDYYKKVLKSLQE